MHAAVAKGLAEHGPKSKDGLESAPRIYLQAAVQLDKPTRRRPLVAKALLFFVGVLYLSSETFAVNDCIFRTEIARAA